MLQVGEEETKDKQMEHNHQVIDRAVEKISHTLEGMRRHNEGSNSVQVILALTTEDLKALAILFESGVVTTRWALLQESTFMPMATTRAVVFSRANVAKTNMQMEPGVASKGKRPPKLRKDLESAPGGGKGKREKIEAISGLETTKDNHGIK